jgi:hypothetical protein
MVQTAGIVNLWGITKARPWPTPSRLPGPIGPWWCRCPPRPQGPRRPMTPGASLWSRARERASSRCQCGRRGGHRRLSAIPGAVDGCRLSPGWPRCGHPTRARPRFRAAEHRGCALDCLHQCRRSQGDSHSSDSSPGDLDRAPWHGGRVRASLQACRARGHAPITQRACARWHVAMPNRHLGSLLV